VGDCAGDRGALSSGIGGGGRLIAGSGSDGRVMNVVMNSPERGCRVEVRSTNVKIMNSPACNATTTVNAVARRTLQVFGSPTQPSPVPESRYLMGMDRAHAEMFPADGCTQADRATARVSPVRYRQRDVRRG
jgi:hypothetical protein